MSILSLKKAALAAYAETQRAAQEYRQEERIENERLARHCFVNIFEIEPDGVTIDGENTLVTAGGFAFLYTADDYGLNLWDKCPHCGQLVIGQRIHSLESLGKALAEGFVPHWRHFERDCQPEPEPAPDPMVTALQAIAAELKRRNDYNGEPVVVGIRPMDEGVILEPAGDDLFMPPDEVWRWLPEAQCVAVDKGGEIFWYGGDIEAGTVAWSTVGIGLADAGFGCLGNRDLGDTDWRTTKRTRPSHL